MFTRTPRTGLATGPTPRTLLPEAFERAIRYRDSFDPRKGEPLSWLIGIARNVIADTMPVPTAELRDVPGFDELHEQTQQRVDVSAPSPSSSSVIRSFVALRYGADLTARQIGEVIEMKTNAVEVALHRALGRLRELLEQPAETEEPAAPRASPEAMSD